MGGRETDVENWERENHCDEINKTGGTRDFYGQFNDRVLKKVIQIIDRLLKKDVIV